jgi:hypothetical protein
MKCKLTKVQSRHNNLRTDEIVGECQEKPTLGFTFHMTAPPLDPDMTLRRIGTTDVIRVSYPPTVECDAEEPGGFMEFATVNSIYHWRPL